MLQMGAEGQAHAHLPGPQATLSSKVNMMQPATLVLNMSSHRFA